jgi:hypothetical protein
MSHYVALNLGFGKLPPTTIYFLPEKITTSAPATTARPGMAII